MKFHVYKAINSSYCKTFNTWGDAQYYCQLNQSDPDNVEWYEEFYIVEEDE